MKQYEKSPKDHIIYLDILRIVAMIGVICIHAGLGKYFSWSNSLFVMISGALWLSRGQMDLRRLWTKNILHIIIAFVFWSVFYTIFHTAVFPRITGSYPTTKEALVMLIQGRYHLWFCYLIIGIYIGLPFWEKIAESDKLLKYFLGVTFTFSFLIPCIQNIPKLEWTTWMTNILHWNWAEYVFYFMLGGGINKCCLKNKWVFFVCLTGIVSFVCKWGEWGNWIGLLINLNMTIFLFVLSKKVFVQRNNNMTYLIEKISGLCFGVYLVHDFFLTIFQLVVSYLWDFEWGNAMRIGQVIFVLCASLGMVYLIRKLPYVGKWIT